ncbi:hypothetical protein SAICODRAFT_192056 [Saitoella complicata NRRL Y-17804]|uniref:uncharacterized protein n=1 Tax=Saitoella complicata (strain BCRC 22490 / CBS 7301 / JCM 7358 / NBRC 10748 / NRRL Y-17804) TaxID=698492 RepID=UPI0008675797|nr:uncharacterized protein SAICODRAFT_192056 [Saitoella complicata NRRL Y-17804]ODQ49692.1 hypothetical protein SAICODRAFT_192056 [Saitoella complicata NRRL Y-17804]
MPKKGSKKSSSAPVAAAPSYHSDSDDEIRGGRASIKAVNTWDDIEHDDEDQFHEERDKIFLGNDPRRRGRGVGYEGNEHLEASDEEVMGGAFEDSEDEEEEEDDMGDDLDDEEEEVDEEEQFDRQGWGGKKKAYYGADEVTDEEDAAKEEEAEAIRLQKKQLAHLAADDFLDDLEEWKADAEEEGGEQGMVLEQLPTAINKDLPKAELKALLSKLSPELGPLAAEFTRLQPQLAPLALLAQRPRHPQHDIITLQYAALSSYLGVMAIYFALKSAPEEEGYGHRVLRDHPVMVSLVRCRQAWEKVKEFAVDYDAVDLPSDAEDEQSEVEELAPMRKTKQQKKGAKRAREYSEDEEDMDDMDFDLDDIRLSPEPAARAGKKSVNTAATTEDDEDLEAAFRALKKSSRVKRRKTATGDDFADSNVLAAVDAEDKASRRKTLRFYAAQIDQKSAKRSTANKYGGDEDVPYKERNRERQERLEREARARGMGKAGADLDGEEEYDDNDFAEAKALRAAAMDAGEDGDAEAYYQSIATTSKSLKSAKKDSYDAAVLASKGTHFEAEDHEGKRGINRQIEKNRGLTARKPKENRNARVKKRIKYEKAKKKVKSQRAVYTGQKGAYGGESTGIKAGLVKSSKFK